MNPFSRTIIRAGIVRAGIVCFAGSISFATVIQNFESGNINLGNSSLAYAGNAGPSVGCASSSSMYAEGTYAVTTSANSCHNLWSPTTAHAGSNFMVVNGSSTVELSSIYTQTVSTGIIAGQTFNFSGYFSGIYSAGAANLILNVYNGIGTTGTLLASSSFTTNLATPENSNPATVAAPWIKQSVSFQASSGTVTVQVLNTNTNAHGNDFGLDTLEIGQSSLNNSNSSPTPEPATFFLAGSVLVGLGLIRRR